MTPPIPNEPPDEGNAVNPGALFDAIFGPVQPPKQEPDAATERGKIELRIAEAEAKEIEARANIAGTEARSANADYWMRILFAPAIFVIALLWLLAVLSVVFCQGFGNPRSPTSQPSDLSFHFVLSDGVLIALITTTTVNVLGLLAAVIAYLFWRKASKPTSTDGPKPTAESVNSSKAVTGSVSEKKD